MLILPSTGLHTQRATIGQLPAWLSPATTAFNQGGLQAPRSANITELMHIELTQPQKLPLHELLQESARKAIHNAQLVQMPLAHTSFQMIQDAHQHLGNLLPFGVSKKLVEKAASPVTGANPDNSLLDSFSATHAQSADYRSTLIPRGELWQLFTPHAVSEAHRHIKHAPDKNPHSRTRARLVPHREERAQKQKHGNLRSAISLLGTLLRAIARQSSFFR